MNTIKTEDLVRFLYNETTNSENLLIETALVYNVELKKEFDSLKCTIDELNSLSFSPSDKSIDRILSHL